MAKPLPPALVRIRDLYPGARLSRALWDQVTALVKAGKDDEAEDVAAAAVKAKPRLAVANAIALKHRQLRRGFLAYQRDLEREARAIFDRMAAKAVTIISGKAAGDGKIPLYQINHIMTRLKQLNAEAHQELRVLIVGGIRDSIRIAIKNTGQSTQAGLELAKTQKATEAHVLEQLGQLDIEMAAISEAEQSATVAQTSVLFHTIFDRVKQRRIERGLFKTRQRGPAQTGYSLSQRVWDLRDGNLARLRRTVSTGIAQGRAAGAIASDVKAMTTVGSFSSSVANPGAGVYRSAWKNALRVTRTETNIAYQDAEMEYAKAKGFKKMWNRSPGSDSPDECAEYDGRVYDPDDYPALPHPNCACFATTIIPEAA